MSCAWIEIPTGAEDPRLLVPSCTYAECPDLSDESVSMEALGLPAFDCCPWCGESIETVDLEEQRQMAMEQIANAAIDEWKVA